MTAQAMQTCTMVDVVFFPPQHPSVEHIQVLPNTHKDTPIYNNIVTFSNVNVHVSIIIIFNLKYCVR